MSRQIIKLTDARFTKPFGYKGKPRPVFKNPLNFAIGQKEKWAVVGDSSKTDFLRVLSGSFTSNGTKARVYPASLTDPLFRTELVRFVNNGEFGFGATDQSGGFTHLSSRYEFFKDLEVDVKTRDFVTNQQYNSTVSFEEERFMKLIEYLNLHGLEDKFITSLSNGQFRRARMAKVLYRDPSFLLIDDPFLGLDPVATQTVSDVLNTVASSPESKSTVTLGFRIQDELPEWIEKVAIVNADGIAQQGDKKDLESELLRLKEEFHKHHEELERKTKETIQAHFNTQKHAKAVSANPDGEPMIQMNGVNIKYKGVPVLKDLHWSVREGEKWHIRGRNGSGKTTLLSLLTLDHPQSWTDKIIIDGVSHQAGNTSYFAANKHVGFTSPELHAIFPKKYTVAETIATGYLVGSYVPPKNLTEAQQTKIVDYLKLVGLEDKKDTTFGDLGVSSQKLVLLLRALINDPRILILDESLSAMTDEDVIKGKCLVNQWDKGCTLIIGHVDEEVPDCQKYIVMNDASKGEYEIGDVADKK